MKLMNTEMQNMNTFLEEDFNTALNIYNKNLKYEDLIKNLAGSDIVKKQFSALHLDIIKSSQDAMILVNNLSGEDSRIREAIGLKINELIKKPKFTSYFKQKEIYDKFLEGIIDVNANVCREVIQIVCFLKENDDEFKQYFISGLKNIFNKTFKDIEKFTFRTKKYVISKKIFNLYWGLETLTYFAKDLEINELKNILIKASKSEDYTVREKVAGILVRNIFEDEELKKLAKQLKKDENYYVRNV